MKIHPEIHSDCYYNLNLPERKVKSFLYISQRQIFFTEFNVSAVSTVLLSHLNLVTWELNENRRGTQRR